MGTIRWSFEFTREVTDEASELAWVCLAVAGTLMACAPSAEHGADEGPAAGETAAPAEAPEPQFTLSAENTHNKFTSAIEPVLRVPSRAVLEVHTNEATGGQLGPDSTVEDLANVDWDLVHDLTGPIFVEAAEPGDTLAVTFHELEVGDWAWTSHSPDFGLLGDELGETWLRTFRIAYLVEERGLTRGDAYALASLAGDLKINEVVDVPHVLVNMHMPENIFR